MRSDRMPVYQTVSYASPSCIFSEGKIKSLCAFFLMKKKNQGYNLLTFCQVYTCVLFICIQPLTIKDKAEFVVCFNLKLAGCELSLIGPFCYRRCTHFCQRDQISRRSNNVLSASEKKYFLMKLSSYIAISIYICRTESYFDVLFFLKI